ncbi:MULTISPECIES: hypothetical protein [unclassified Streptomyces]|uniref:hypothetical protein n=1 Tax=unclassified Streptomyces TaxID=2593676 RepID=UPI0036512A22
MKSRSFKVSVGVTTAALALAMAATSTAQAAPARALSTAGPFDTYHDCRVVMNEYNRYYEIDSDCFQYPVFGVYWFYYH